MIIIIIEIIKIVINSDICNRFRIYLLLDTFETLSLQL